MDKVILKTPIYIFLLLSVLSCKNNSETSEVIDEIAFSEFPMWLEGSWKQDQEEDDEPYIEIWKFKGDTLIGGGYFTDLVEIDTLSPQVKIYNVKGGMVHEFIGSPELTLFPVKSVDANTFICINPDPKTFPSSLKYTRLNPKQMIIEITGNVDGIQDSYAFNMYKQ